LATLSIVPEQASTASSPQLEREVVGAYQQYSPQLSRYAASLAQDSDAARDAVQEVFLRYFVERRYGREIANPRAWLYHVLRNYLLDQHRSVTNREVIAEDLDHMPGSQQNPERLLQRSEVARELQAALSAREFECLRLRTEGLDYAEIAEVMGIRSGTVGALLARAQKKIRRSAEGDCSSPLSAAEAVRSLFEKREAYS